MTKTCLKCSHTTQGQPDICPHCGAVYAKLEQLAGSGQFIRAAHVPTAAEKEAARLRQVAAQEQRLRSAQEALDHARMSGDWRGFPADVLQREADAVVLSTADHVPGSAVEAVRGLVSADYAFAFGAIFEELAGFMRNVVGSGSSGQTVEFLQAGRAAVLAGLRTQALHCGANAVVAIRIDYEEFSGANQRGIYVVTGTGTAVRVARDAPDPQKVTLGP